MASFKPAYRRTNAYEGEGTVNHWADRGGETYAGISRLYHPDWAGWEVLDIIANDMRPATERERRALGDLHEEFFLREFWGKTGCHYLADQDLAEELYDSAVNCGQGRAQEWLQVALNASNRRGTLWPDLKVDGRVGQVTAGAALEAARMPLRKWLVLQVMETQQRSHYLHLALADRTQEENMLGWFRLRVQYASPPPTP